MSLASSKPYYGAGFIGWFRGLYRNLTPAPPAPGTVSVAVTSATVSVSTQSATVGVSVCT